MVWRDGMEICVCEGCVGNGMRLGILCVSVYAFAFELFDGLVKDYGVCVWTYAFALGVCYAFEGCVGVCYAFGLMRLDLCVWLYALVPFSVTR